MDAMDLRYIVPGAVPGEWEVSATPPSHHDDAIQVRSCWCYVSLDGVEAYCPPDTDICSISFGKANCRINSTKGNMARIVWPFALFLSVTFLYLLVTSITGKFARAYVRRQLGNATACFRGHAPVQPDTDTVEVVKIEEEVEATVQVMADDLPASGTASRDEALPLGNTGENGADSEDPPVAQPLAPSGYTTALPASYPSEIFGRQSNIDQLLRELHRLRETHQRELFASLWHLAFSREYQSASRAQRQARLRSWITGQPYNDSENVPQERLWWGTPRTLRLVLKTKRFQSSVVNGGREGSVQGLHTDEGPNEANAAFDEHMEPRDGDMCAICLSQLEDGDIVGDIPCKHLFHKECLKSWLTRSTRCPLCQNEALETGTEGPAGPRADVQRAGETQVEGQQTVGS